MKPNQQKLKPKPSENGSIDTEKADRKNPEIIPEKSFCGISIQSNGYSPVMETVFKEK